MRRKSLLSLSSALSGSGSANKYPPLKSLCSVYTIVFDEKSKRLTAECKHKVLPQTQSATLFLASAVLPEQLFPPHHDRGGHCFPTAQIPDGVSSSSLLHLLNPPNQQTRWLMTNMMSPDSALTIRCAHTQALHRVVSIHAWACPASLPFASLCFPLKTTSKDKTTKKNKSQHLSCDQVS